MIQTASRRILTFCATGVAAGAFCVSAHAQLPAAQLVEMGGSAQAVAEVCGDYTSEQLRQMKEQQRGNAASMGVTPEQFDQAFEAAYDKTRGKIAAASPERKAQMCEQMKALGSMR